MGSPVVMARTPTSAPGSEPCGGRVGARGFTLIELLIVVALIAIASAVASLALRDPATTQLEREGARLAALLESARAEARALGVAVRWVPGGTEGGFRFVGLPDALALPSQWLGEGVNAEALAERRPVAAIVLGPEPLIGVQRIVLRLDNQHLTLATDGLGPFAVVADEEPARATR
ncbi:Tfp pilus assembly protein FimT/FimU [Methylibium sp.]|uniref:pilus assembly FimT family protein n=1 Tax=Methylibium sp. TaxID=2067992 RepID=UPI0038F6ECFC